MRHFPSWHISLSRLPHRAGVERLRDDGGFAIPIVMVALVVAFGLATVTVVASVGTQSGAVRDQNTKSAFAAAEAGVSEALLHFNRIPVTTATPCLAGSPAVPAAAGAGGWCAGVTRSISGVQNASFTYWVKPTTAQIEIVSQGSVNGVTRQVDVMARSSSGLRPFDGSASVIGLDFLQMDSWARITANVATNGDLTMESNSELTCNYAEVGIGQSVNTASNAHYTCPAPVQGTTSLPPVNQGDVATNNSNGRFFALDTYTGGAPTWNPATRQLTLDSNRTLTLAGSNYSFCKLTLNSNTSLFIAAGSTVRIYFDSPENCNLPDNTTQLSLNSNARISATAGVPADIALLFVGSDTLATNALLSSNTQANQACEQNFVVYAPRTNVTLNSNSYFCGAMAGKSIHIDSNSDVRTSNLASEFELPDTVAQHYVPEEFVECNAAATSPPDAGC